jgi:uncharacterized protein (TIGR02266 family)
MVEKNVRRLLVNYQAANAAGPTSAVARDAALGGLFIETAAPLPIGTLLSVELTAPSATVTLEGRVFSAKPSAEGPDRPAGMGVRFLDLPASVLVRLQAVLDHHRPPARTRIGVGDEKEALWATAGGRDDSGASIEDDSLALAASVQVDGRPTIETEEIPIATGVPRPDPTPRMVPITPMSGPAAPPAGWSTPPSVPPPGYGQAPPAPWVGQSFPPPPAANARRTSTFVVVLVLGVLLGLLGLGVIGWIWATRLR